MTLGLLAVLALILAAEFVNGWTDAPNAIATTVSTKSLSPRAAVIMASILNLAGVLSGTAVAKTIGSGIVDPNSINLLTVGAAVAGIVIWSSIAARAGIPTSESHALVAGLAGAGLATAGPEALVLSGWIKVGTGLLFSTFLGFGGAFVVMVIVYRLFRRFAPGEVKSLFRHLQVLSSAFMAFSHGSNDGQKFMGIFTLALVLGGILPDMDIPLWVILLCALTMALGTMTGGWKIIHTMGGRVTRLETHQGFAAELAAASTIELASHYGIPLSTTHTISTAIVGVGTVRRASAVRWGVTGEIVTAWILTFPICGAISWGIVMAVKLFVGK